MKASEARELSESNEPEPPNEYARYRQTEAKAHVL